MRERECARARRADAPTTRTRAEMLRQREGHRQEIYAAVWNQVDASLADTFATCGLNRIARAFGDTGLVALALFAESVIDNPLFTPGFHRKLYASLGDARDTAPPPRLAPARAGSSTRRGPGADAVANADGAREMPRGGVVGGSGARVAPATGRGAVGC